MAMFNASDKAKGINTLSVAALTEAEKLQEGEIARFKGCSHKSSACPLGRVRAAGRLGV
jgi:hypothetical protein